MLFQNEVTFADRAHRFCVCLFCKSDEAFGVLKTALEKEGMAQIRQKLERKEEIGWVQNWELRNTNIRLCLSHQLKRLLSYRS